MTDKKHTPLPWEIRKVQTSIGHCYKILPEGFFDDGHQSIACLYDDNTSFNPYGDGVQAANAEFILSAVTSAPTLQSDLDAKTEECARLWSVIDRMLKGETFSKEFWDDLRIVKDRNTLEAKP